MMGDKRLPRNALAREDESHTKITPKRQRSKGVNPTRKLGRRSPAKTAAGMKPSASEQIDWDGELGSSPSVTIESKATCTTRTASLFRDHSVRSNAPNMVPWLESSTGRPRGSLTAQPSSSAEASTMEDTEAETIEDSCILVVDPMASGDGRSVHLQNRVSPRREERSRGPQREHGRQREDGRHRSPRREQHSPRRRREEERREHRDNLQRKRADAKREHKRHQHSVDSTEIRRLADELLELGSVDYDTKRLLDKFVARCKEIKDRRRTNRSPSRPGKSERPSHFDELKLGIEPIPVCNDVFHGSTGTFPPAPIIGLPGEFSPHQSRKDIFNVDHTDSSIAKPRHRQASRSPAHRRNFALSRSRSRSPRNRRQSTGTAPTLDIPVATRQPSRTPLRHSNQRPRSKSRSPLRRHVSPGSYRHPRSKSRSPLRGHRSPESRSPENKRSRGGARAFNQSRGHVRRHSMTPQHLPSSGNRGMRRPSSSDHSHRPRLQRRELSLPSIRTSYAREDASIPSMFQHSLKSFFTTPIPVPRTVSDDKTAPSLGTWGWRPDSRQRQARRASSPPVNDELSVERFFGSKASRRRSHV